MKRNTYGELLKPAMIGTMQLKNRICMNPRDDLINIIGDALLYFLPMMLAVTAYKKMGCNPYVAIAITGALLHPNYTALITNAYNIHFSSIFGLPVTLASYSSSVIPVVLMVFLLKCVDQF